MVANLTCSEDSLWFLSMAAESGYHDSCLALVAHKTEILDCQAPHPFPERWTTWGRRRQDHPTSRGQIPFAPELFNYD